MIEAVVNNTIKLEYPSSFKPVTDIEKRMIYPNNSLPFWGIWDKKSHVIVTMLYERRNSLILKIADEKSMVKRNASLMKKLYKERDYIFEDYLSRDGKNHHYEGYIFNYRHDEKIRQTVRTIIFKDNKYIYSLSVIGRMENSDNDTKLLDNILKSMEY